MDIPLIFFSFTEAILTVLVGLGAALLTLFVLVRLFLHKSAFQEIREGNAAVGILAGAAVFAVVWLTRSAVPPSLEGLRQVLLRSGAFQPELLKLSVLYFFSFSAGAVVFSLSLVCLILKIFALVTRNIHEETEILHRNLAVALLLASVLITLSLSLEPAMGKFFGSWVNYEKFERALGPTPQVRPVPGPGLSP